LFAKFQDFFFCRQFTAVVSKFSADFCQQICLQKRHCPPRVCKIPDNQEFETSVLNRIKDSRQAHDGDSHSSPLVRQRDANSVVTMSFIQDMLHLSDYERMKQLASIMNENRGHLIVQLNDEEANVLTDIHVEVHRRYSLSRYII
jgi:hypothetical protein